MENLRSQEYASCRFSFFNDFFLYKYRLFRELFRLKSKTFKTLFLKMKLTHFLFFAIISADGLYQNRMRNAIQAAPSIYYRDFPSMGDFRIVSYRGNQRRPSRIPFSETRRQMFRKRFNL